MSLTPLDGKEYRPDGSIDSASSCLPIDRADRWVHERRLVPTGKTDHPGGRRV